MTITWRRYFFQCFLGKLVTQGASGDLAQMGSPLFKAVWSFHLFYVNQVLSRTARGTYL